MTHLKAITSEPIKHKLANIDSLLPRDPIIHLSLLPKQLIKFGENAEVPTCHIERMKGSKIFHEAAISDPITAIQ